MPRSVFDPVVVRVPCAKSEEILSICTPVPICLAGVFDPAPEMGGGVDACRMLLNESAYCIRDALKPDVFTLAMLLPITSMPFSKLVSALTPLVRDPMSAMML